MKAYVDGKGEHTADIEESMEQYLSRGHRTLRSIKGTHQLIVSEANTKRLTAQAVSQLPESTCIPPHADLPRYRPVLHPFVSGRRIFVAQMRGAVVGGALRM